MAQLSELLVNGHARIIGNLYAPNATTGVAGLMSTTDKSKLDGIASGAQVNVLEAIKLNGVSVTITSKAVNIVNFTGTDGTANGTAGLVPAPTSSDSDKYLKSDGTWSAVSGGGGTSDYDQLSNRPQINSVTLTGNKSLADLSIQGVLTAGTNITLSGNTISATDTTYSNFTGTDGTSDGVSGLVPAPITTDVGKFLKANGAWADTIETLTSPVRIWGLADGVYKIPSGCIIYYKGETDTTTSVTISTTGYLFVTSYSTTYKNWFILCGNTSTTRYLYNGYSTSTNGASTAFNLGSSYLTGISSYVKNNLTYSTSTTTYALSAYQGYILDQNKENVSNKVTSVSSASTDVQYPSAKLLYDQLALKEDALNKVTSISSLSTDIEYPSAKLVYDQLALKQNKVTYSTTDLTAGTSPLAEGEIYLVYE